MSAETGHREKWGQNQEWFKRLLFFIMLFLCGVYLNFFDRSPQSTWRSEAWDTKGSLLPPCSSLTLYLHFVFFGRYRPCFVTMFQAPPATGLYRYYFPPITITIHHGNLRVRSKTRLPEYVGTPGRIRVCNLLSGILFPVCKRRVAHWTCQPPRMASPMLEPCECPTLLLLWVPQTRSCS